jgi:hypothetical protein
MDTNPTANGPLLRIVFSSPRRVNTLLATTTPQVLAAAHRTDALALSPPFAALPDRHAEQLSRQEEQRAVGAADGPFDAS